MFFRPSSRHISASTAICTNLTLLLGLLTMLLALFTTGCGKKGDPLPPLRTVPMGTQDLVVRQQGQWILLEMTYPATTIGGQVLGGIDAVELHQLTKPAPSEEMPTTEAAEFIAGAELQRTLRGTELESAIVGDQLQIRIPLAEISADDPRADVFAVRTGKGLELSDFSNRVTLVPVEPPPAPTDLDAASQRGGIELSWQSEPAEGFDIFRRLATSRGYGPPIKSANGDQRKIVDTTARYGERYIYTVRAITGTEVRAESELASEREIEYEDLFPPRLASGLVALPEQGSVRLRWDPSRDRDTAGYIVLRRDPGQ